MTDESRGRGGLVGPPWSVDVLADLHAGVLDEQDATEVWRRVNDDPEARAIIEALESTTADLSELAQDIPPMPADVAQRIDAAVEQERRAHQADVAAPTAAPGAEAPGGGNVVSLDAARRRRHRRLGWGAGLLTAAAAIVAGVVVVLPGGSEDTVTPPPVAAPPYQVPTQGTGAPEEEPLAVSSGNPAAAVSDISGVRDFGPLGNEERLDACLAANGVDPAVKPVGFRPVTVDGDQAVMVILTTGELGRLRLLALSPDCGPDTPGTLMDETVGHQG